MARSGSVVRRGHHCEERQRRGNVVVPDSSVALNRPRGEPFQSTLTEQGDLSAIDTASLAV
jgi:hypothetical protein